MTTKDTNPKDAIGTRKVGFSALPWRVLYNLGLGMMEGAAKYGRHNYRAAGVRASVYFDATVARHIGPWWEGEDIDPESGLHHIDKAIVSLLVLRDSMLEGNFVDDRPPRGHIDLPALNEMAGQILDRHADKVVHHYTIKDPQVQNVMPVITPVPSPAPSYIEQKMAPVYEALGKMAPVKLK